MTCWRPSRRPGSEKETINEFAERLNAEIPSCEGLMALCTNRNAGPN